MAATPKNLTPEEAQQVANSIAPQMNQLQALLAQAGSSVQTQQQSKRDLAVQDIGCDGPCITAKAGGLVSEISGTIRGVIGTLGISKSFAPSRPLLQKSSG